MPSPSPSPAPRMLPFRWLPFMERAAGAVFAAIAFIGVVASIFLGPTVLIVVLIAGLLLLAMEPLVRGSEAHETARHAADAGVHGDIAVWGKVVDVTGRCPSGPTPDRGQTFVVTGGQVWPRMCAHLEEAILREVEHMQRDPGAPDEPIYIHDADHSVHIELYRAPAHLHAA